MIDPEVQNSSGYFKDPITKEDLSVDTPRVIPASLENGKFQWPMVLSSDGENLLKIVFRYFTDEEKQLYNEYRGRPTSSERQPRKKVEPQKQQEPEEPAPTVVTYTEDNTDDPLAILMLLAECDTQYGVSFINGNMYCLVGKRGTGKYYHIRRELIPDDEWHRIYEAYYPEA